MSFKASFRQWCRAFHKLMTVDDKRKQSDRQVDRVRQRRLKAKYSSAHLYRVKKKRKGRRSHSVTNGKALSAILGFFATMLSIMMKGNTTDDRT